MADVFCDAGACGQRIKWIDAARGIAIFAIVLGHTVSAGYLRFYVNSFHVPLFFLLSGLCFTDPVKISKYFIKKVKTVVVPYVVFSVVSIIIFSLLSSFVLEIKNDADTDFFNNLFYMLYGNSKPDLLKFNMPLWFLPCYFVVAMGAWLIEKLIRKSGRQHMIRIFLIVFFAVGGSLIGLLNGSLRLPWHAETAVSMMGFYLLGIEVKNRMIQFSRFVNRKSKLFFSVTLLLIDAFCCQFNTLIGVRIDNYGNPFLFYLCALSGCFGWILFGMVLSESRVLNYIGRNTLAILVMHKFPILVFQYILPFAKDFLTMPDTIQGIAAMLIATGVTVSLCLAAGEIIRHICPWMLGMKNTQNNNAVSDVSRPEIVLHYPT